MDPTLRVAANDPHLVSLGGGRLSTAVTIHYIPIGKTTVGSSSGCTVSLNGPGIESVHCQIYRSPENNVCIEPKQNARTLIDGQAIFEKTNLTQGAMITIGNSYYLRFNNPQEAQLIRSVIESNDDGENIVKNRNVDNRENGKRKIETIEKHLFSNNRIDSKIRTEDWNIVRKQNNLNIRGCDDSYQLQHSAVHNNLTPSDISGLHCPKVFTSDSITVNMPAKDVLGQKYVNFAKNLIENHRSVKNVGNALLNNKVNNMKLNTNYNLNEAKLINISNNCIEIGTTQLDFNNDNGSSNGNINVNANVNNKAEYSVKVNNITTLSKAIEPGAYATFKLHPLDVGNSETNKKHMERSVEQRVNNEDLEDMLKLCSEYADLQNKQHKNAMTLSPIVQNRIKTNGSLPREKKSPFNYDFTNGNCSNGGNGSISFLSDQLHQQILTDNNITEYNNSVENYRPCDVKETQTQKAISYENLVTGVGIGKYVPQSPRTKIRTTCLSPKKENVFDKHTEMKRINHNYEQLIKIFEEKFNFEIKTIKECTRSISPERAEAQIQLKAKKSNKNINNLTLILHSTPEFRREPLSVPISGLQKSFENDETTGNSIKSYSHIEADQLNALRKDLVKHINYLTSHITNWPKHENDIEVSNKINISFADVKSDLCNQLQMLQNKIHRLESQRNATRVMEENKQAKLKQSIEMKQDQICRLKKMLEQHPADVCYKEELNNLSESLENDYKAFEDLEFQYLEEESEWHAYCEELHAEEKALRLKIEENRLNIEQLERNDIENKRVASTSASLSLTLPSRDIDFLNEHHVSAAHDKLQRSKSHLNTLKVHNNNNNQNEHNILKFKDLSKSTEEETKIFRNNKSEPKSAANIKMQPMQGASIEKDTSIKESLFGSTEIIYSKYDGNSVPSIMSRSIDDNILCNCNNIELPSRLSIEYAKVLSDNLAISNIMDHKNNNNNNNMGTDKLFNGYNDYKVNILEKKHLSQDNIDRISKLIVENPISAKNSTTKIFDSIKEIEKNRQLLLTQQGHHDHERQRMNDLKVNNEARAQCITKNSQNHQQQESSNVISEDKSRTDILNVNTSAEINNNKENIDNFVASKRENFIQRHSNPELDRNHSSLSYNKTRPLSETNFEISCELLSENSRLKSGDELLVNNGCKLRETCEAVEKISDNVNSNGLNNTHFSSNSVVGRKKQIAKFQRPLTRYLPISSPDLNLRKHIESAGHQISLCPHIFIDAYSCRGYLHKLGATFHGWSKRWFVLDRQCNAFIYYADKSERKPRGGAYFTTINEVYLDHLNVSKSTRPHCTFVVKTKKRSFHLQAASSAAARIWIDALITGAQGNFNYYTINQNSTYNNATTN